MEVLVVDGQTDNRPLCSGHTASIDISVCVCPLVDERLSWMRTRPVCTPPTREHSFKATHCSRSPRRFGEGRIFHGSRQLEMKNTIQALQMLLPGILGQSLSRFRSLFRVNWADWEGIRGKLNRCSFPTTAGLAGVGNAALAFLPAPIRTLKRSVGRGRAGWCSAGLALASVETL